MTKKITMQEIADMVGVSKVTVSKALNGKDGVGVELKQKIQKIAKEYGYQLPIKQISNGITGKKIAIFCDDIYFDETDNGYFYIKIYKQITYELAQRGSIASLITVKKDMDYKSLRNFFDSQNFDGSILLGNLEEKFLNFIKTISKPLVFVDSDKGDLEGNSVVIENFYSTYLLTKHLLENGHRDIGFVGTTYVTQSINDRYLGYCRAMMEYNLSIKKEWIIKDRDFDNVRIDIDLPKTLPTAFVCNCDCSAYYLEKILNEHEIKIPEDISVVSFDNDSFAELCSTPLTTVDVNVVDMAQKATNRILELIENPQADKNSIQLVDTDIIYRKSVKEIPLKINNKNIVE